MKTLSIRQPWAELILQGRKTIELRTWRTNYRGRIAIHAAQAIKEGASEAYGLSPDTLVRGALVGTVEIVDVFDFDEGSYDSLRQEHLALNHWPGDVVGWRLTQAERLDTPIPLTGRQGLFDVDDTLLNGSAPESASAPNPDPIPPDCPFELRVEPSDERSYSVALYQWPLRPNGIPAQARRVMTLSGDSLRAVSDHLIEALRRAGYKLTDLSSKRRAPFWLAEEDGVRLGLLFLSIAPLSKMERVEAISREIRGMPAEEAYYWYSKCTVGPAAPRAQRALRVLLAAE